MGLRTGLPVRTKHTFTELLLFPGPELGDAGVAKFPSLKDDALAGMQGEDGCTEEHFKAPEVL